ncbi:MAG: hypothetical protein ACLFRR_08390 [Spirochaetaceae bacterium]
MAFAQHSKPLLTATAALAALLLPALLVSAEPVDVELSGWAGNLGFSSGRASDDTGLGHDTLSWEGRAAVTGTVLDGFLLTGAYEHDSAMGDTVGVTLGYSGQIMTVAAGPFLGFLAESDTPHLLKPGLTASMRTDLWNVGFLSLTGDVTLAAELDTDNTDFRQYRVSPRLGFYVPNIVGTFEYDRTVLLYADGDGGREEDRETEYAFSAEVFRKAIPYRILLRMGYRHREKTFPDGGAHGLGAALFTPGFTYDPGNALRLTLRLENGLYVFGREDLLGEVAADRYFFRAHLGARVRFE